MTEVITTVEEMIEIEMITEVTETIENVQIQEVEIEKEEKGDINNLLALHQKLEDQFIKPKNINNKNKIMKIYLNKPKIIKIYPNKPKIIKIYLNKPKIIKIYLNKHLKYHNKHPQMNCL